MFGIKQMVFISVTGKFMFEEKIGIYLFSIEKQHLGTLCFALVFALSFFWHLCFIPYLPGGFFLMNQCHNFRNKRMMLQYFQG